MRTNCAESRSSARMCRERKDYGDTAIAIGSSVNVIT